ncbi:LLM class flavin-dependent oxidoreductase [Roseobacter sp.]|uniref:LLM class flavin-dependent oxidoreductase n=1 Tax=Roseobacter sp. TaxID=1907202 RepID=UPI00385E7597
MQIVQEGARRTRAAQLQVGVWLPVYGSWLRTTELPISSNVQACLALAQHADALNYDFLYASENLLNPIHGLSANLIDAWSLIAALAPMTERVGLIGAIKPGFRSPLQAARIIDTTASLANRKVSLNIVCGWWEEEFDRAGVPWLDHSRRYDRADAFLDDLYALFEGSQMGVSRQHRPCLWVAGHSARAIDMAARNGGCLFLNGMDDEALARQVRKVKTASGTNQTNVTVAINAHVIAAPTQSAANDRLESFVAKKDQTSIAYFRDVMAQSGAESWKGLSDLEMVDSNAGFAAGMIGDYDTLRSRLAALHDMGVDRILCQFDHPERDAALFMQEVVAPVRAQIERKDVLPAH